MGLIAADRMRWSRYFLWLGLATLLVALDLWTKHLATQTLELYRPRAVTGWLNFTLAHNDGAAFSFLAGAGGWQRWFFTAVAILVSGVLLVWLKGLPNRARLLPVSLMLILGGALGNMVDRIRQGYVVDFIDVHYQGWHWPAFNIADSVIVLGVTLLLIEGFIPRRVPMQGSS